MSSFIGTPVVKLVSDRLVRVTGISLPVNGCAINIGLHESVLPPGVRLPADFMPRDYKLDIDGAGLVGLQDSVQCWFVYQNPGSFLNAISVVKTGTTPQDFLITLTNNTSSEGGDSGELEIYVAFH